MTIMLLSNIKINCQNNTESLHSGISLPQSVEDLTQGLKADEIFIAESDYAIDVFFIAENRKKFKTEFLKQFAVKTLSSNENIEKYIENYESADAVRRFYQCAIGLKTSGEITQNLRSFRNGFDIARELKLVGPYLNRLYQRGVWLAEKIRIDLNLQKSAITPESVIADLAAKIFGNLSDHKALVAVNNSDCEKYLRKLGEKQIGQFLFLEGSANSRKLSNRFGGEMIAEDYLIKALISVDLLLVFDEKVFNNLLRLDISKIMHERNNAPLLCLSLFNNIETAAKTNGFSRHYNVYYYNKSDLDSIVHDNLKAYQKTAVSVNNLIEQEVEGFFIWANSNKQYQSGDIIGKSEEMQKILEMIARIAQTDISVLIDGESGTGKELIAKSIHEHSSRSNNPFVVVNCGAIPDTLLESELFGHVKGAFTGAVTNKKGLFEAANFGTIFLDEIGETSQATQVKLLRFLQEGEVKPVGSNETLKLNVRVITATNRNLEKMVEDGSFRQDLFYRLNVIQITIPPLRDRKADILPLAEFFVKKYSTSIHKMVFGLDEKAQEQITSYHWPGNVRELENAIERAVALSTSETISVSDLPPAMIAAQTANNRHVFTGNMTLRDLEKAHIAAMLKKHDWNYDLVTEILGIGRTTLWRKMKEYKITQ